MLIWVNWVYIICHTFSKFIYEKVVLVKSLQHVGSYDISSSESNLNILLPSIAKNTVWIPDSCVELIFQLKFTLLLILQLISMHGGGWWVMSFYVPFSSYQQICQGGESCREIVEHSHQVDPCHPRIVFCVCHCSSLFCSWNWDLWKSVWRIKNNRAFEYLGIADPIGCLPYIHFPSLLLFSRNLILVKFYPVGKVTPSPALGWILSNLSL